MKLKELRLVGRGFPSEVLLKEDGKLTYFCTGLPNYGVLKAVFNLIERKLLDTSIKLTKFQSFVLFLMKFRLN